MKCPICGMEIMVDLSCDADGNDEWVAIHYCKVKGTTKGDALAEYQRRVDELRMECAECINVDDQYAYDACSDCFYRDTYFVEDSWDD